MDDFYGSKCFDMQFGGNVVDGAKHVGVVSEWQVWVKPADDVDFGCAGIQGSLRFMADAIHVVFVSAVLAGLAVESTELAGECADVGVVEVAIDVVIGGGAVKFVADMVGKAANGLDVVGLEKGEPIFRRQAGLCENFVRNGSE